jgi:hypothetical protein
MQQSDVRISALNHLAVKFQHQTQNAMRRWMLRPEVKGVVFDFSHTQTA